MDNGYWKVSGRETTNLCIDVEALAQHSSSRIRAILAASDTTPAEVLRSLAVDTDGSVRLAAALNRKCPSDVLQRLSVDTDWLLRLGLATQLDVCEDILLALARHKNPYVAAQSCHALNAQALERKLKGLSISCQPGSTHKLGELFVAAKKVNAEHLSAALALSKSHGLRLGRVLLQVGIVSSEAIVEALRLQNLLRRNEIEIADAMEILSQTELNEGMVSEDFPWIRV